MVEDDVMILDSGDEVYVWLGNDSDEQERVESLKLAKVTVFRAFLSTILYYNSKIRQKLGIPFALIGLYNFSELHRY